LALKPLHFIGQEIQVEFNKKPTLEKKPTAPDRFEWQDETYLVESTLSEWKDFGRRGRMAHNMRAHNKAKALRRGSWGVGRFYFRVLTSGGRIFDLYYDRAPKNVADRKGSWFLDREMSLQE
jgi:hypothetical protein